MDLTGRIREIAEAELTDSSHFVVAVVISGRQEPRKILIVVDGDRGITIDDCVNLSRNVSRVLDDNSLITGDYRLEITSPGLDHPLKLKRQYIKNAGRRLRVVSGGRTLEGKLVQANEEGIILELDRKEEAALTIPYEQIERAIVLTTFK